MWYYIAGAVLETLSVNEENLDHHYTRHERSRSSRREDERLPWRKAKRFVVQDHHLGVTVMNTRLLDKCLATYEACLPVREMHRADALKSRMHCDKTLKAPQAIESSSKAAAAI